MARAVRTRYPGEGEQAAESVSQLPRFGAQSCFASSFQCDARWQRAVPQLAFEKFKRISDHNTAVWEAVELFLQEHDYLATDTPAQVLVRAPPAEFYDIVDPGTTVSVNEEDDEKPEDAEFTTGLHVFHHVLKARAMRLQKPVQLVRPRSYGGKASQSQRRRRTKDPRPLQDEATRAWNFHTAIYFNADGVPWRMVRESAELTTCYVGISFYKSLDEATVLTSLAQEFNERGDGVVVRGGQARPAKDDRTPHLDGSDAAITRYRRSTRTCPRAWWCIRVRDSCPTSVTGSRRQ